MSLQRSVTARRILHGAWQRYTEPQPWLFRDVSGLVVGRRGAKTTTVKKMKDLPQGALGPVDISSAIEDEPAPTYPRVLQQHFNNVQKFSDCVVLTRIGNFYELYGEQAEKYGPLLNLKVARRKTAMGNVAMSGFQIFQLDRYLKTLVQDLNKSVAISEELRNSAADEVKAGDLKYDRKVTRVITAGTLIDEAFVDPYENNFLLSIHSERGFDNDAVEGTDTPHADAPDELIGLSWVDLSSGDFYTQETTAKALSSMVARVMPKEILVQPTSITDPARAKSIIGEGNYSLNHHVSSGKFDSIGSWDAVLDRPISPEDFQCSSAEMKAASLLLDYVSSKLQEVPITLRPPIRRTDEDSMRIDKHTLRGLEIRTTLRDNLYAGSLLHAVRKTVTKSGARALTRRLVAPSMSLTTINRRLDLVEEFVEQEHLREAISAMLERTFDTPRLVQKFSLGRGDADDLLGIGKTIDIVKQLFEKVSSHAALTETSGTRLQSVLHEIGNIDFSKLDKLCKRISSSIDEDGLSRQQMAEHEQASELADFAEQVVESEQTGKKVKKPAKRDEDMDDGDIWVMRRNASPTLLRIHRDLDEKFAAKSDLAADLRETFSCSSLSLKWTPNLGHFCHVKGKDCKIDFPSARNLSSSKTTRSFHLPAWTSLGQQIEHTKHRIRAEEQRVFASLRADVIANLVKLRRCASILDSLDIACSSALLATTHSLVRPILHSGTATTIIAGRHPMVDLHLRSAGRSFVPNDCVLTPSSNIALITGPNMAGKSTFLRQNALIAVLAQTGLFVPAAHAELGLVDRVFSRVGSADDLSNAQSTFMVEMAEVASILSQATRRSLVVMDEVGRGTAPVAGLAVAGACVRFLHEKVGCRTLFATHFHDLAEETVDLPGVERWCTDVEEDGEGWVYVHKLRKGVNRDSHALKVARLAGLPEEAIGMAREALDRLEGRSTTGRTGRAAAGSG